MIFHKELFDILNKRETKKLFTGAEGLLTSKKFPTLFSFFQEFRGQNHCWELAADIFFETSHPFTSHHLLSAITKKNPSKNENWCLQLEKFCQRLKEFRFLEDMAALMRDALGFASENNIEEIFDLMNQNCHHDLLFLLFHEKALKDEKTFFEAFKTFEKTLKDKKERQALERKTEEELRESRNEQKIKLEEVARNLACKFKAESKAFELLSAREKIAILNRALEQLNW